MSLPPLQTVTADGLTIAYREQGAGPALVLLHGLGGSSATWEGQYAAFADRHRVIGWDMPGYGGSDNLPAASPVADDYAAALAAFLDALTVDRSHIVGQSVAALIAGAFCASRPDRALSFIFAHGLAGLGRLAPPAREEAKAARLKAFDELGAAGFAEQRGRRILGPQTPPEIADRAVAIMAAVPPEGYHRAIEMMASSDFFGVAPDIAAPSLVICGAADPVAPEDACREAHAALAGATLRILPAMGHYSCMEDPELFNDCLGRFLAGLDNGR